MSKQQHSRYMLIDGNALIHRGFHAIPSLSTKTGEPTNAVYGFTSILLRAIKDLKPTHIAATFDLKGPTFRHEQYAEYKATRVKAPQELYDQIPRVKEVVRALNIPIFEKEGFEADDCLGTLAKHICSEHEKCDVMIVTGDMDTLQLVNDCVKIYTLRKGLTDTAIYDIEAVKERFGLRPDQMVDYKALRGDPSDNIKGVQGIGEKGAAALIKQFGSIDELYEALHDGTADDKVKPRFREMLLEQEEQARFSYKLSEIVTNVPLEIEIPTYEFTHKQMPEVMRIFGELEFQSLLAKLPKTYVGEIESTKEVEAGEEAKFVKGTLDEAVLQEHMANSDYKLINTATALEEILPKLKKAKLLAIDTETTSINAVDADLLGISMSIKKGEGYYICGDVLKTHLKQLQEIIGDKSIPKVGHNSKYDLLTLRNGNFHLDGISFDTMIASYLSNSAVRQHSLDALAFNELQYQMQPITDLIGVGKKAITMDAVPVEKVAWYAAEDADITLQLKSVLEPRLTEEGVEKIFNEIEMPLIPVLAEMESHGISLDTALLGEYEALAEKELHAIEKEIYKQAGEEFNINSPKQLKEILFEKLGLSSEGNRKTKTGVSTAAGELEKMLGLHPIIEKIMEYRELNKLQSTYITALPELLSPKTGRLHTNYNQTIAATGRLSSTDPNLQNIPVKDNRQGIEIRRAFVADRGYKFVSLDYSQIELRIVAHLANDEAMAEVFKKGEDIHTSTAVRVFGVKPEEVTKDQRRNAKAVNFGILYGLSSFGLSRGSGMTPAESKEFINKYFAAYPGVFKYIEGIKEEVKANAVVKNELGRQRKFPDIRSSMFQVRAAAERAAMNFPIQSLQADIIKLAMINIHEEIKGKAEEIKMLLQVHDELVFEIKEDKVDSWIKKLKPLMEQAYTLSVPIIVEGKIGANWGDMKKLSK